MTGTRVATQIKDLPYTVNVLTSEFFEDFGMFQLDDTLTQVGGLTSLDHRRRLQPPRFQLHLPAARRLLPAWPLRPRRTSTAWKSSRARTRASTAATSPGGMVNMISKGPAEGGKPKKLTLRYGSFDTSQGTLEATGTVGSPRTYYIVIGSQFNRGADMDWFHIRENQGFLAVKHDFDNGGHPAGLPRSISCNIAMRRCPPPRSSRTRRTPR